MQTSNAGGGSATELSVIEPAMMHPTCALCTPARRSILLISLEIMSPMMSSLSEPFAAKQTRTASRIGAPRRHHPERGRERDLLSAGERREHFADRMGSGGYHVRRLPLQRAGAGPIPTAVSTAASRPRPI